MLREKPLLQLKIGAIQHFGVFHGRIDPLPEYRAGYWPGVVEQLQLLKDKNTFFVAMASVFVQRLTHQPRNQ